MLKLLPDIARIDFDETYFALSRSAEGGGSKDVHCQLFEGVYLVYHEWLADGRTQPYQLGAFIKQESAEKLAREWLSILTHITLDGVGVIAA